MNLLLFCNWAVSDVPEARVVAPDEAVRLALAAAPSIDGQRAEVRQARRDVAIAGADLAPTLTFTGSYTRLSEVEVPPLSFGGVDLDNPFAPILDNYKVEAEVRWPVSDLFFAMLPAYRARKHTARVQKARLEVERNEVAHTTLVAYYQLAQARAGIDVAEAGVKVLEASVTQLEDLFSVGRVTQADSLSARAQLAEARAQRETLVQQEAVAEARLASLLDVPPPLQVVLPNPVDTPVSTAPAADLVATARSHRPEVKMLDELIDTHRFAARAQRGAALPHLALVGHYTYANPNQRIIPPTAEFYDTWDATIALSWSPNESAKRANAASQSKTEELKARADREELERGLEVQVAKVRADVLAADRLASVAQEQLDAADAAFRAQSDLLGAGMATATEALQAEASSRRAQHALLDARVDRILAGIELSYATGTLLNPPEETPR